MSDDGGLQYWAELEQQEYGAWLDSLDMPAVFTYKRPIKICTKCGETKPITEFSKCECGCKQPLGANYHCDHIIPSAFGVLRETPVLSEHRQVWRPVNARITLGE